MNEDLSGILPTDAEVADYRKKGYYVSRRIYSDEEIGAAIVAQDRLYRGDQDTDFKLPWGWQPEDGNVLRKTDYACFAMHALMRMVKKPALSAIAARLSGAKEIRLWHDQCLYKPGTDKPTGNVNVGWHTDRGYWMSASSEDMLTAWAPYQDTDASNGTVTMVEGSHHWPLSEGLNFFDGNLDELEKNFNTGGNPVIKVPLVIPKGCASFHHCLIIHGSGPNLTPHPRRSMAVHFQPGDNHFQVWKDKDGNQADHANDQFVRKDSRGFPDYADPKICPRLFPA
jgi:ectoine hydroxylase-related dioxygenase (phytanoyl-CoA dioxygenase family)